MKHLSRIMVMLFLIATSLLSCNYPNVKSTSDSGVVKATTKVETDLDGHTIEQKNIIERYRRDNAPGSIKHLYIISQTGQVLVYSTVKGKVTSSSKRLNPSTVQGCNPNAGANNYVNIGGTTYITDEVVQDDGTYGSSIPYIYWFDSKNVYHQEYISSNMVYHISDEPLAVKNVVMNLEIKSAE